jgi:DNA-binding transcriptional LysR family regulator
MNIAIMESDMDSSLLKVFVAVADEGSLSGAGKRLHYVQSNITARLKQLEESTGRQLFYRKPRGVVLTPAGEELLPHAREIVKRIEDAENLIKNMGEASGRLRIGSTESNAALRLAPALVSMHTAYPKLEIHLITGPTKSIIEDLLNYKLDVAFVSGHPESSEIEVLKTFDEEMVMVEPADSSKPDVIITFKKGCTYKERLEKYLAERNAGDYTAMEFGSLETILACVSAGMGRTILPRRVVEKISDLQNIRLRELPEEYCNIPTCLICRKDAMPVIDLSVLDISD